MSTATAPRLQTIKLEEIRENPAALRAVNRKKDSFTEIVASIKKEGVLNPINVREKAGEDGKKYEIIDGLHRFSAAQEAGLTEIPAQILTRDDAQALIAQVIGNVQRVETRPVEYANGLLRILTHNPTMTQAGLATQLSKSPAWIDEVLGLVKLHEKIAGLVNEGKIIVSNAYPLSKLPPEEQLNWLDRAITTPPQEFGTQVKARVKEIRDAARAGKDAPSEQFKPVMHLRNKKEIESEIGNPQTIVALLREHSITDPIAAAKFALDWVMNYDPKSQAAQKAKYEAHQKELADNKARRQQEQAAKRKKEAEESMAKMEADKKAATATGPDGKVAEVNPAPANRGGVTPAAAPAAKK